MIKIIDNKGSLVKCIDSFQTPFYIGQILKIINCSYETEKGIRYTGTLKDIKTGVIFGSGWRLERFKIIESSNSFHSLNRFKEAKRKLSKFREKEEIR